MYGLDNESVWCGSRKHEEFYLWFSSISSIKFYHTCSHSVVPHKSTVTLGVCTAFLSKNLLLLVWPRPVFLVEEYIYQIFNLARKPQLSLQYIWSNRLEAIQDARRPRHFLPTVPCGRCFSSWRCNNSCESTKRSSRLLRTLALKVCNYFAIYL